MKNMIKTMLLVLCLFSLLSAQCCGSPNKEIIFSFNKHVSIGSYTFAGTGFIFSPGLEGDALSLSAESGFPHLSLGDLPLDSSKDFSVQFWMKTASDKPTVLLSQKDFTKKGHHHPEKSWQGGRYNDVPRTGALRISLCPN